MNKPTFTNRLVAAVTSLALLCCSVVAQAQSTPPASLCKQEGTVIAFFNGVMTTKKQADDIKEELARILGTTDPNGEEIRYEVMYNQAHFLDDFLETFEQRLNEQDGLLRNRFELFFESMRGGGSWWSNITHAIASTAQLLSALGDDALAGQVRALTGLRNNAPTRLDYQEHRTRIDNYILEGKKILFVAHSQGNLFANVAYDYASPKTPPGSIKLVHIAPASPTLRGQHILAQLDLVINGLRLTGTVPGITHTIPGYLLRPAGANNKTDILGHGMFEIYINRHLGISTAVNNAINTALAELVVPPAQASSGFFTATLTWDGTGDVDTHVTEPDNTHVWYQNTQGHSGYLDKDNTVADGPEHYYASCDASTLQIGDYEVAVANYANAEGRQATVQIASYQGGVLGTKSVVLGAATGDTPSATLFTVHVARDANGRYSVTTR